MKEYYETRTSVWYRLGEITAIKGKLHGRKTAKRTNKLEPVPAHWRHGTDKFPRASSQTQTAYILHSQFRMSRFIAAPNSLHLAQFFFLLQLSAIIYLAKINFQSLLSSSSHLPTYRLNAITDNNRETVSRNLWEITRFREIQIYEHVVTGKGTLVH